MQPTNRYRPIRCQFGEQLDSIPRRDEAGR
jgi:hypothetical protein